MVEYTTKFRLSNNVIDINEANEYLHDDNMAVYLLNDFPSLRNLDIKIEWTLTHPNKGYILLTANEEIPEDTLDKISAWVLEQNSDGLGEGFCDQDFSFYEDDEGNTIQCEFDWRNNEYKFERI